LDDFTFDNFWSKRDTLCQFMGIAQIILTPICGHLSCMQVFNWLLELIQARKSWIEHPIQQVKGASGLLFVTPEKTKSQGVVQSQGLIHCYSAGSSGDLAAAVHNRLAPLVPLAGTSIVCLSALIPIPILIILMSNNALMFIR
jgi:hypothetical protein